MSRTVVARWRDWSGEGTEHLVLRERPDGIQADAVVIGVVDDETFALRYRITCDAGWRTRRLEVGLIGADNGLDLSSDGAGRWTLRGAPLPDLGGAIDVDLTATPFTNTLPIRRLGLRRGQAEVIVVVYVEVPPFTVTASRQRYTCLEPGRRYRFESLDSGFTRDIDVDDDGLVLTYPDLFRRVA